MDMITTSNPDVILPGLFTDLCNLGCKIAALDIDKKLSKRFDDVLRKLYISAELYNKSVIAIAGLQGVGKTFFLRNYLKLDEKWLKDNTGRGERFPVLVLEKDGIKKPYGVIRKLVLNKKNTLEPCETEVTPEEFSQVVRSSLNEKTLLPILYTPPTTGFSDFGMLLLPGYETKQEDWQELMCHAMLSAGLPVIVTDSQSLATDGTKAIRENLQQKFLENVDPVIVYSKIDEQDSRPESGFEEVKRVFAIKSEDQLVYAGAGSPEYIENWRAKFSDVLEKNATLQLGWRKKQLMQLKNLLSTELQYVLDDLKSEISEKINLGLHSGMSIQILDKFDASNMKIRSKYNKILCDLMQKRVGEAVKLAKARYKEEEGGNVVKVVCRKVVDFFTNDDRKEENLNKILEDVWNETEGNFDEGYLNELTNFTWTQLNINNVVAVPATSSYEENQLQKWGTYPKESKNSPMKISDEVSENVRILFYSPCDDRSKEQDKQLESTIKLLPILAVEFARLNTLRSYQNVHINKPGTGSNFAENFQANSESGKKIIRTLGYMMAIDVCADGKVDTIPALWNVLSGGVNAAAGVAVASNPYVLAATVVFVVGMAAVSATQQVNLEHRLCRRSLIEGVGAIGAAMQDNIMRNYDKMMSELREAIENRLANRYQIDQTFGEQESAIKMIAQVYRSKNDLLGNINVDTILA